MVMEINGKTAVVTGGASGLGKATVKHLASLGAKVAIFDVSREAGEHFLKEMGSENVLFARWTLLIPQMLFKQLKQ